MQPADPSTLETERFGDLIRFLGTSRCIPCQNADGRCVLSHGNATCMLCTGTPNECHFTRTVTRTVPDFTPDEMTSSTSLVYLHREGLMPGQVLQPTSQSRPNFPLTSQYSHWSTITQYSSPFITPVISLGGDHARGSSSTYQITCMSFHSGKEIPYPCKRDWHSTSICP